MNHTIFGMIEEFVTQAGYTGSHFSIKSFLNNRNSQTCKVTSLNWDDPLASTCPSVSSSLYMHFSICCCNMVLNAFEKSLIHSFRSAWRSWNSHWISWKNMIFTNSNAGIIVKKYFHMIHTFCLCGRIHIGTSYMMILLHAPENEGHWCNYSVIVRLMICSMVIHLNNWKKMNYSYCYFCYHPSQFSMEKNSACDLNTELIYYY